MSPPALSVVRMSNPMREVWQGEMWMVNRLVSVQDGTVQLCRCTLGPPHTHPLLPDAVNDAFWFPFLSVRPRVMNNVDNTETRALCYHKIWHKVILLYFTLHLLQHRCAFCCEDLPDLLPVLFPPCLRCGRACQWKVASAQGVTGCGLWAAGCCLEETRHEKKPGGSWQPMFCKTPNI